MREDDVKQKLKEGDAIFDDIDEKTREKVTSLVETVSSSIDQATAIANIINKRVQASIKLNTRAVAAGKAAQVGGAAGGLLERLHQQAVRRPR